MSEAYGRVAADLEDGTFAGRLFRAANLKVQLLILLHVDGREWRTVELARAVGTTEGNASMRLRALERAGFVTRAGWGKWRYKP